MTNDQNDNFDESAWFVFDGGCPICSFAAHALRIREALGSLNLVDARAEPNHPLALEISALGLNLDEGMVFRVRGINYHGDGALHMMAILGSDSGWFNRVNAFLFRFRAIAGFLYPVLRAMRNQLLRVKGVSKLDNLASAAVGRPIFQHAFGESWSSLPRVMRDHYAVRERSNDQVEVSGHLDVEVQWWLRIVARLTGMLVPYEGQNGPVSVVFKAGERPRSLVFDRTFQFPGRRAVSFRSSMEVLDNGDCVEFMKFGFRWRLKYSLEGKTVVLRHRGYVWRLAGFSMLLPISWLFGEGFAEETPLNDTDFSMRTHTTHRLLGQTFGYAGRFTITQVSCDPS